MSRRLAGFMIDCQHGGLAAASRFWSEALGLAIVDADESGHGRYAVLGAAAGGLHVEVQMVTHPSRLHLDIEADDIDAEAAALETLGATRVGNPRGRWWVMQAPSGHRFCVIRKHAEEPASPPRASGPRPGHRSGVVALVLDCQVDSLAASVEFWSAALQRPIASRDQDGDGKYAELRSADDQPFLLLQKVGHEARVHLDIETDDLDAEVARLKALGAQPVEFIRRWWVMQAPTGHRFCVVHQQSQKKDLQLNAWA